VVSHVCDMPIRAGFKALCLHNLPISIGLEGLHVCKVLIWSEYISVFVTLFRQSRLNMPCLHRRLFLPSLLCRLFCRVFDVH